MKFEKIQRLLADNNYIADLINKSAGIFDDGKKIKEIDPLWIDANPSQKVTDLYSIITHESNMFLNDVIVVEQCANRRGKHYSQFIPSIIRVFVICSIPYDSPVHHKRI